MPQAPWAWSPGFQPVCSVSGPSVLHGEFPPEEKSGGDFIAAPQVWRDNNLSNHAGNGTACAAPPLPTESSRCNLVVVSPLENIVEDLKALPPPKLQMAADYIHRLKDVSEEERKAALSRTFGCLSSEEADELERVIKEGCEQVNEHGW